MIGIPRPARPGVPPLRYLAAWTRARFCSAFTVARPRPTGGTLELYVCGRGGPPRAVDAVDVEIDANGDIVPAIPDLLERMFGHLVDVLNVGATTDHAARSDPP